MAKWVRKYTFGNDTATSLIGMNISGVEGVAKYLSSSRKNVLRMADNVTSKTAAEARKEATDLEEQALDFQMTETHSKWSNKLGRVKRKSAWNSSLGGYESSTRTNKKGRHLRLINFKNVKTAANYGHYHQSGDGSSSVRMTSLMANLWENDALYTKPSPYWGTNGKWSRWYLKDGQPFRRPGKHYFQSAFKSAINSTVPEAVELAKRKFKEDQRKAEEEAKAR